MDKKLGSIQLTMILAGAGFGLGLALSAATDALNNYFQTDSAQWIVGIAMGLVIGINLLRQIVVSWQSRDHYKVGGTD